MVLLVSGVVLARRNMARRVDCVKDLGDHKGLWKIAVRIVDIWQVISKGGQQHLEMVFKDEKGDTVQAIVPSADLEKIKPILKEGQTYIIQSFHVQHNDLPAKVSTHPFKIILGASASIMEKELPKIPHTNFNFQTFESILNGKIKNDVLLDVIGGVQEILFLQPNGDKRKAAFAVRDLAGESLNVTLWDDYATKFIDFWKQHSECGSIVIILTHAKYKEPQGRYAASVSNWWYGSKLLINEDIQELQDFKKKLPVMDIVEHSTQSLSQFSGYSQGTQGGSDEDKFMKGAQVMTLAQINCLQKDAIAITVATIVRVEPLSYGWFYQGCNQCPKKCLKKGDNYYCVDGHVSLAPLRKYKIEVTVMDKKDRSKFMLWDTDVARQLEISADDLMKKMLDEGEEDENAYPLDIDFLCGRSAAFKVKAGPRIKPASVSWMWSGVDMVNRINGLIESQEQTSKLKIENVNVMQSGKQDSGKELVEYENEQESRVEKIISTPLRITDTETIGELHFQTQDLSATAEFDPAVLPITPAKRKTTEPMSQEIGSTQLSSTKTMKHIKKEGN